MLTISINSWQFLKSGWKKSFAMQIAYFDANGSERILRVFYVPGCVKNMDAQLEI